MEVDMANDNLSDALTEADGRRLAVNMLVEMRDLGADELVIDRADEYRDGRPQNDVLVRYLRTAREQPRVEAGFLAVLTDVLGSAVEGGGAIELYEREANHD
jgi:hypothetical protein